MDDKKNKMFAVEELDLAAKREFFRAKDNFPLYYELASGEETRDELDWEAFFDELEPKSEDNAELYELLFDINQKLNMLLRHMTEKSGFNLPQARQVSISGGGMRFVCQDLFKAGDKLTLKAFLPTCAHVVRLKCEAVRVDRIKDGYEVAVKYLDMDDGIREKIIKYIFAKQRKLLRLKGGEPEKPEKE
ncbi:MAG: PilZ domain-containing protein [Deltaproteobacteria bacterium]